MRSLRFVLSLAIVLVPVSAAAQDDTVDMRMEAVWNSLLPPVIVEGEPVESWMMNVNDRMRELNITGVSVAVIDGGEIDWVKGYGSPGAGIENPIMPWTMFQAASISKPITATAALALVERGVLDPDAPVNDALTSWQIPENEFTAAEPVTLRHLLTHTAGLTVGGFLGYAAGEDVPTLLQVLDGAPPANSDPVRVTMIPGTEWSYSGGGYTVLQLLLQDVTGQPFEALMAELVLAPIGMETAMFAQPLPDDLRGRSAVGHRPDGSRIEGRFHTYPELAAAGLWATPTDLARWAIAISKAANGEPGGVLSPEMARQMLTPQAGQQALGPMIYDFGDDGIAFGHSGGNEGFRCFMVMHTGTGQGAVIMTNSDNGGILVNELLRSVAHVYGWDLFQPEVRSAVEVAPETLDTYTGTYTSSFASVPVYREGDQLFIDVPSELGGTLALYPASETEFFDLLNGFEITFLLDGEGDVIGLRAESEMLGGFIFERQAE